MSLSRNSILLLLVIVVLLVIVALMYSSGNHVPEDFRMLGSSANTFPEGQEVSLGTLTMKLDRTFIWVSKNAGPFLPRLKPGKNACVRIPYEVPSAHFDAVAQTEVSICNMDGKMYYYYLPINS